LNSLIEFLAGGAGRSTLGSVGASAARAASRYEAQQTAAQRERAKEIEGMREKLRKQGEDVERGRFTSELEGLRAFEPSARSALEAGAGVLGRDIAARASALETEARQVANALARQQMDDTRQERSYSSLMQRRAALINDISESIDKQYDMQLKQAALNPNNPKSAETLRMVEMAKREAIRTSPALQETAAIMNRLAKDLGMATVTPQQTQAAPVNTQGFNITGVRPSK